jgi:hypothetical protein
MDTRKKFFLPLAWAALLCGCAGNLKTGYSALYITRNVGDKASLTLGELSKEAHQRCLAKAKKPGVEGEMVDVEVYKGCISKYKSAVEHWMNFIKPAVNSALAATWGALETARAAKSKNVNWVALLKPGLRALVEALEQWRGLMPKKAAEMLNQLSAIRKAVCR